MRPDRILLTPLLALGFAGLSHASVVISTLGQDVSASVSFLDVNERCASDFLTDGTEWTITSLTAQLVNLSPLSTLTVTFSIWTDDGGGVPGTLVSVFNTPATLPPNANALFTATSPGINLQANTPYWLVGQVNEETLGPAAWRYNISETSTGPFSTVSATPILRSGNGGVDYTGVDPGNFLFSLEGDITPVPEPSVGLALVVTVGTFLSIRWWRQRQMV